jgi:hypothetical protein
MTPVLAGAHREITTGAVADGFKIQSVTARRWTGFNARLLNCAGSLLRAVSSVSRNDELTLILMTLCKMSHHPEKIERVRIRGAMLRNQ